MYSASSIPSIIIVSGPSSIYTYLYDIDYGISVHKSEHDLPPIIITNARKRDWCYCPYMCVYQNIL